MEIPQSRSLGAEGRKPTHDFLSLYSHSTTQQDPIQEGYLKTHDFLRPLERIGKTCAKEETTIDASTVEQLPPPLAAPPASDEHLLPGGIGTYTISHISYFNQRVPKSEGSVFTVSQASSSDRNDDNSRCSSLSGSGFTLWDESAAIKGKTRKENLGEKPALREPPAKIGKWAGSTERPSQPSSSNHCNSYNSLSSSQFSGQKSQSFVEMLKSVVKVSSKVEELDNGEGFVIKKESPSSAYEGDLRINVGGKCSDQKVNTPRSKHSATEQRRRSKINDRFQKLRELIPRSDQKRDKASFLLEVIEYIQFLQERVQKYEGPPQEWYCEPAKSILPRNNCNPAACYVNQSQGINSGSAFIFAAKSDEKNMPDSPAFPGCSHNPVESEISSATTLREVNQHSGTTHKATPYAHFTPVTNESPTIKLQSRLSFDEDNKPCPVQRALCETRLCSTDVAAVSNKLKEPEQIIEGGRISISSAYSLGLLNTLTQALQSSGVNMSQASVDVQIELGNRTNSTQTVPTPAITDVAVCPRRTRVAAAEDMEQACKKKKKT